MKRTSLDFSRRSELATHASIAAAVQSVAGPLGLTPLIAGAFARDLHLVYEHGIETGRKTEDVDFAISVPDWAAFGSLRNGLIASGAFTENPQAVVHRLRFRGSLPVDLVPFGGVETDDRTIDWPPSGDVIMNVFGFQEALADAHDVLLPDAVRIKVVSLPALAILKLVCWQDRHSSAPGKDAHDLALVMRNYVDAGHRTRLFDEFGAWTVEQDFDYGLAGARLLGHDMRALLDAAGAERVMRILSEQADPDRPGLLPSEMMAIDPDRGVALIASTLRGLRDRA
jgi:predicted nucleotidyltransferase